MKGSIVAVGIVGLVGLVAAVATIVDHGTSPEELASSVVRQKLRPAATKASSVTPPTDRAKLAPIKVRRDLQALLTHKTRFTVEPTPEGPIVRDNTTSRRWVRAPSAATFPWEGAKAYCDGLTLGGIRDWRLPRIEEFQGLVAQGDPPLPHDHPFTPAGIEYWTSTSSTINNALRVLITNGTPHYQSRDATFGAWCVSGGGNTAYPGSNPRFNEVGASVDDLETGRRWSRAPVAGDWYGARRGCHAIGPGWRLATQSEMAGLLDLSAPETPKLPPGHPFAHSWPPYDGWREWLLDPQGPDVSATVRLSDGQFASQARLGGSALRGRCIASDPQQPWPQGQVGRFVVSDSGDVVRDRETELLWERAPSPTAARWSDLAAACAAHELDGLTGWRLPEIHEIESLLDLHVDGPAKLPAGHPFVVSVSHDYWTTTVIQYTDVRTLRLSTGKRHWMSKGGAQLLGWCVRPGPA